MYELANKFNSTPNLHFTISAKLTTLCPYSQKTDLYNAAWSVTYIVNKYSESSLT